MKILLVFFALVVFTACTHSVDIDIETGNRQIVLNSILDAKNDTIWVELTWSKPITESYEDEVIDNATIVLEQNDDSLGIFRYAGNGKYYFIETPCENDSYKIIVNVAGHITWGQAFVPPAPLAIIELQDRVCGLYEILLNSYSSNDYTLWISASSILERDGIEFKDICKGLAADNILYDDFNRFSSASFCSFVYEYDYFIRILETPAANNNSLEFAIGTLSRNEKHEITVFAVDENLDKYIKYSILARNAEMFMEESPINTDLVLSFSNVQGGVGLVGSINKTTSIFTHP